MRWALNIQTKEKQPDLKMTAGGREERERKRDVGP